MVSGILVPVDGSAASNAALPLARTVARETGASITLMRVVQPDDRASFKDGAATLKRISAEVAESGVHVEAVTRESDDVAHAILRQSRDQSADLVIMRTHGRAGVERAVLGSVTQRVLAESGVPVMLMRPGGRRLGHIRKLLVPIDGSPGGSLALGTAVQLAQSTGAAIKLLEVAVPVATWLYAGDVYGTMAYYDPAWDEEALASAQSYVEGMVSRLRAANVEADGEARQERFVAEAIVDAAAKTDADLIVMSTRALTGPARALLGSTADEVVRRAQCPVLLTHRTDASEGAPLDVAADTPAEPVSSTV
jgi:nucleotide-binding universal stress UspA family protein